MALWSPDCIPECSETGRVSSAGAFVARVAACVSTYVVLYVLTGALNYALVSGPYSETHAGGLNTPAPAVVAAVAILEGIILSVGMVPVVTRLVGSLRSLAVASGVALFVLGGLVPLLQQPTLPDAIRVASAWEILAQKLPLGVVVFLLLAPATVRAPSRALADAARGLGDA